MALWNMAATEGKFPVSNVDSQNLTLYSQLFFSSVPTRSSTVASRFYTLCLRLCQVLFPTNFMSRRVRWIVSLPIVSRDRAHHRCTVLPFLTPPFVSLNCIFQQRDLRPNELTDVRSVLPGLQARLGPRIRCVLIYCLYKSASNEKKLSRILCASFRVVLTSLAYFYQIAPLAYDTIVTFLTVGKAIRIRRGREGMDLGSGNKLVATFIREGIAFLRFVLLATQSRTGIFYYILISAANLVRSFLQTFRFSS